MYIRTTSRVATNLLEIFAALRSAPAVLVAVAMITLLSLPAIAQNAVPLVYEPTVPTSAVPGGSTFTLTVSGAGFVPASVINWNGTPQTTTYVSGEKLTASIPASNIVTAGTATITVTSPAPGGGTSNPVYFAVSAKYASVALLRRDISAPTPDGIVAGDFTGNGILDLAVANNPSTNGPGNDVAIYIGNGDGTFKSPVLYAVGHPGAITVGDFNGDGKLDIAVLQPLVGQVAILLGNGDGTFGSPVQYATGQNPSALAVADVNQDGILDIVVANFNSNTVSVLLGNGNGTFKTHQDYATGNGPTSVAVADFNGDGHLDLAVANNSDGTVSIMLNNGTGGFPTHTDLATAIAPTAIVVGDFNGDGNPDLALSAASQFLSVLIGNGNGTFNTHKDYSTGTNSQMISTADMNADGFLDLVVANFTDNSLSILQGKGDGTFKPQTVYPTNSGPAFLAIGDFNNAGKPDVAVVDYSANMVSVMTQSQLSITPTLTQFGFEELGIPTAPVNLTLKNAAASAYGITGISIGGLYAGDYSLGTGTCGSSVAANSSCKIAVIFNPQPVGSQWWLRSQNLAGQVTVNGSDGSSTGAELVGSGQVGITLGPTRAYKFATQLVNTSSPAGVFLFTNNSGVPITLTSINITGLNAGDFQQTNNCPIPPATLAGGASCTANMVYHPTIVSSGEFSTLNFFGTFSPGNGQQAVEFTASSTAVAIKPKSLNFPGTKVGTSSSPLAIVFTNAGSSALPITSMTLQGADPHDFVVSSNTCGSSVPPVSSCKIGITFTPQATGTRTVNLVIGDPDPTGPQTVPLAGTGD